VDSEPAITSADIPAVKPEKHVILVHQNVWACQDGCCATSHNFVQVFLRWRRDGWWLRTGAQCLRTGSFCTRGNCTISVSPQAVGLTYCYTQLDNFCPTSTAIAVQDLARFLIVLQLRELTPLLQTHPYGILLQYKSSSEFLIGVSDSRNVICSTYDGSQ
jgi:hypothetical protein